MNIRCAIVDDEPLALEGIQSYVEKIPYLNCIGTFSSALDLLEKIDELKPDLLFMDIQMPHLTGLDFVKSLTNPPKVIFTTAYDQYALEGFELDVVDYLMKPISFDRFLKASEKAKAFFKENQDDWFFVKTDKRTERIKYDDILVIEALQNYVSIHTRQGKHIVHITMKAILESLSSNQFLQPHKSYIVNLKAIDALEGNCLVIQDKKIPISRNNRDEVIEQVVNSRLLRK